MPPFRDIPIQQKLIVTILVTTALALLLSGTAILVLDSAFFRAQLRQDLSAQAQIIAENSTAAVAFNDPRAAEDTLASLRARPHVVTACIVRLDGSRLATFSRPGSGEPCPAPRSADDIWFAANDLTVSRTILLKDRPIGKLVLVYDLGEISERLRFYGAMVLGILLVSGLIALLVSADLRKRIVAPIEALANYTSHVAQTRDYTVRARKTSQDELGVLVDSFNDMLFSIQARDDNLKKALTEREQALSDARNTRESLRTTLASIGDAVLATDAEGRVAFANPEAQKLLRRTEAEMIGQPLEHFFNLVEERSRETLESPVKQVLRTGTMAGLRDQTVLVAADGSEIPIDESASPIRAESGQVTGVVLTFRDITGRRQNEAELRSAREQLQLVTDTMASAVTRCSRDLRYIWVSRQYGKRLNIAPEKMAGQPIAAIVGENAYRVVWPFIERVLTGERVEFETEVDYRTIGRRWIRGTYVPTRDRNGAVDGWVAEVTDITALKQAQAHVVKINEELQRSNSSLARSNDDLERFAYVASHDLQEPLRMVTTYSQLLIRSYAGELRGEATTFVGNIVEGTRRMRTLLSDLLAYTAINAGADEQIETVDLNGALENAKNNLKAAIAESEALITSDRLPSLRGHEGHFVSLLQNLIGNAIKYRGSEAPRIHVAAGIVDGLLQVTVADNGMGIAPEYHQKIFIPFKRLHGRKIPGSGIGLAICQRVVERYGGRIWVESEEGAGSRFIFVVPETAVVDRDAMATTERSDGHAAI
jgi:PAS domain S-box-containing protein